MRRWAFVWTWQERKDVATKKEGMALAREWKRRYEEKGWRVSATKGLFPGYNAFSPEYRHEDYNTHGPDAPSHTCLVVELDENDKWIMPPFKMKPEKKVTEAKPRRGRKPQGV